MMRKPRALRAGDTIGLIAPSSGLNDAALADRAAEMLRRHGFEVKLGESCRAVHGYLAGQDALRARDTNTFFEDRTIDGIVCLRGGYGTPRILDALDYGMIARNPKVFVGYSDITGLHLAFHRHCALPTLHGPMGTSDALLADEPVTTGSWLRALTSHKPLGRIENPAGLPPMRALRGGRARGPLIGGNLSLVAATLGTPYGLDARGKLLFLEDVDERPFRVDRMLTQLRLAGVFDACAGILLGDWADCEPEEGKASLDLLEIFRDILSPCGKPVLMGLQAGHCSPALTLPFGVEAVMDADTGTLDITESVFVE